MSENKQKKEKHTGSWLYIPIICLLVLVIVMAVVRCRRLIHEIGTDRTVTGSYVWEMELPAQDDWFYLTVFQDNTFTFYGPKDDMFREVESGICEYDETKNDLIMGIVESYKETDMKGLRLISRNGTEYRVIHFGDRLFVATDSGLTSFKKCSGTPTEWSVSE